jgi:uncharacterized protein YjeT (DUF2065 family)
MLAIWRIAPGEVGVRELLLGVVFVGVLAGLMVGRYTERARRNFKEYGAARTAVPKARQLAVETIRSAGGKIIVWGAILIFAIVVFMNLTPARS